MFGQLRLSVRHISINITRFYHHRKQSYVWITSTNVQHSGTKMSSTKYFRFNPLIGKPDSFPIDEVDPDRLQELCDIVDRYMEEEEQQAKLKQLGDVIHRK